MTTYLEHVIDRADISRIDRGEVVGTNADGRLLVRLTGEQTTLTCDVLVTSDSAVRWEAGDQVLLWLSAMDSTGVVLGRIGLAFPKRGAEDTKDVPDTLVLEAKQSLTLRVGDGSITIREDGKILIKGKDLVSHAQRMNRIKGGAVSIN